MRDLVVAAPSPTRQKRSSREGTIDASPHATVAETAANALMHAYADRGSRAIHACTASDGDTGCGCSIPNAKINPIWGPTFATW